MPRASGMFKSDFSPLGLDLYVYVKEATITSAVDATYSEDKVILLYYINLTYFLYISINTMHFGLQKYHKNNCY